MAATLHIDIVSAEKQIYSGRVEMVTVTGEWGELGIVPGHAQLISQLKPGQVRLNLPNGADDIFYVSGGLIEVQPYLVTVLADTADRAKDLDEAQAEEAMKKARHLLDEKHAEVDYAAALAEIARVTAQLRAIRAIKNKNK